MITSHDLRIMAELGVRTMLYSNVIENTRFHMIPEIRLEGNLPPNLDRIFM